MNIEYRKGMMGIPFPEEYGGSEGDWVGMHVCIEGISRGDITLGALLDVTTSIVAQELYVFGTEEQKIKWPGMPRPPLKSYWRTAEFQKTTCWEIRTMFTQHLAVLETGRISNAAMAVGGAQPCLDEALRYARERTQFRQPIFGLQTIQFKLADMAVRLKISPA